MIQRLKYLFYFTVLCMIVITATISIASESEEPQEPAANDHRAEWDEKFTSLSSNPQDYVWLPGVISTPLSYQSHKNKIKLVQEVVAD